MNSTVRLIERLAEARAYERLKGYQQRTMAKLFALSDIASLKGMYIAEIGGDGDFSAARCLAEASGNRVRIFNPAMRDSVIADSEIEPIKQGFEVSIHSRCGFDLIYGCAVLEHIGDMEGCINSCHAALKPGGWLLLQGGPMWNSPYGHHLYVKVDGKYYTFDDNNVVPDWCQWLYSREEVVDFLKAKGLPEKVRDLIGWQIYESDMLNRTCTDEILSLFNENIWELAFDEYENGVPQHVREKGGMGNRKGVASLYIAARKK